MAKTDQRKNEALRLHRNGMAPSKIATKLGISLRSVQRWLKDETPVSIQVVAMPADKDLPPSVPTDCRNKFDMTLSRRMAIRLLNLSEAALNAVEDTLSDPDARRTDKLRAAKLVGDWLGLNGVRNAGGGFIPTSRRVEEVFGVSLTPQKPPQERSALSMMFAPGDDNDDDGDN